jgi:hypothetical protein
VLISSVLQILDCGQLRTRNGSELEKNESVPAFNNPASQPTGAVSEPEVKQAPPAPALVRPILPEIHLPTGGMHGVEEFLRAIRKDEEKSAPARKVDVFE